MANTITVRTCVACGRADDLLSTRPLCRDGAKCNSRDADTWAPGMWRRERNGGEPRFCDFEECDQAPVAGSIMCASHNEPACEQATTTAPRGASHEGGDDHGDRALLASLARASDDYALPVSLVRENTTTGTVIVHNDDGAAVLDTMTPVPGLGCDWDAYVVAAINHAPALAREVLRLRGTADARPGPASMHPEHLAFRAKDAEQAHADLANQLHAARIEIDHLRAHRDDQETELRRLRSAEAQPAEDPQDVATKTMIRAADAVRDWRTEVGVDGSWSHNPIEMATAQRLEEMLRTRAWAPERSRERAQPGVESGANDHGRDGDTHPGTGSREREAPGVAARLRGQHASASCEGGRRIEGGARDGVRGPSEPDRDACEVAESRSIADAKNVRDAVDAQSDDAVAKAKAIMAAHHAAATPNACAATQSKDGLDYFCRAEGGHAGCAKGVHAWQLTAAPKAATPTPSVDLYAALVEIRDLLDGGQPCAALAVLTRVAKGGAS